MQHICSGADAHKGSGGGRVCGLGEGWRFGGVLKAVVCNCGKWKENSVEEIGLQ